MTQTAYKFRFYPTKAQALLLEQTFGCVRVVYNRALAYSKAEYDPGNKTKLSDWNRHLTARKKQPEFAWLKDVSSVPLQQALRHLDNAFKSFFKSGFGYPRFKSKRDKQSAHFMANAFTFDVNTKALTLAKMKTPLKIKCSRDFRGGPSSVSVSKTQTGKYYIALCLEEDKQPLPVTQKTVGVDVGIKSLAVCSDGIVFSNPKTTAQYAKKLANAQQKLAKKVKGSCNFKKQRQRVAKIHEKIASIRRDCTHKMTSKLINENQVIGLESLRVKNMVKNKRLAKALHDANFGEIMRQLTYKAEWAGRTLVKVDQWFPSSKQCSCCGELYQGKWSLSIRQWHCRCGAVHDRDINAAQNILQEGLRLASG